MNSESWISLLALFFIAETLAYGQVRQDIYQLFDGKYHALLLPILLLC